MTCAFSFCFGQADKLPASSLTCQIIAEGTNLTLTGQPDGVMATRTEILNLYPTKIHLNLKIPDQDCTKLRIECEKIANETNTTISITEPIPQSSFASQNTVNIHITGIPDNADLARVHTLVMLDKMSQLDVDTVAIPYKLHHLICGRKRTGIQSILEETATSIYFPSPFIFGENEDYSPEIYITGEASDVARVKDMLTKLAAQKAQSMYHKDAVLHPRKLDWMLLHRRSDLRKIMRDNGSFVSFPKMGSGGNLVTVYAESRVNAERTLRSLHFLACGIYEACFYFNRDGAIYGADTVHTFFNSIANITALVSQLSQVSGAEVSYRTDPGCIEVYGTERAIRHVYQRLHDMSFLKMFHQSTVFNVELSNDQREFISGKKSGKINKIMKTSGAKIKFVPFSEYNFIIEVESNNFNKALDGLTLLQEELPAEISFYVPEVYHKRIIGVGGKNIQRIMKKYGVYVKFSNAEEFAALGGYYDNEDNVVARTPMKNQINLENLRHAVMDLINPKDRDCVEQVLYDIPFWLHRTLIRDQAAYLAEMTKKTNTHLIWPDDEAASDCLTLVGPESQVGLAAQMVRSVVPEEYDVHLPYSTHLNTVLESDSYKEVVQRIAGDYNVSVEVKTKKQQEGENESDQVIAFKMTKGNLDCLSVSLEILISYFKSQQVNLYEDSAVVRHAANPTIAGMPVPNSINYPFSAAMAFDSKMMPSALPSDLVSPTPSSSSSLLNDFPPPPLSGMNSGLKSYSLFDYPSSTSGNAFDASWKNFRDMNSPKTVENIRAIFDTPEANKPPPPPSISLVSPLSFRGGPPPTSSAQNGLDIWSNPPQQVSLNGFVGSPPLSGFVESKPQHSMLYSMDHHNTHHLHHHHNGSNGFYQPLGAKPEFNNAYVVPTSSTSTGSNNSSMHSTQSMPDIMLDSSSPKKTANLPFQINNYIHTQTPPPPLIYPSSTTTTAAATANGNSNPLSPSAAAVKFALSSSVSTPTTAAAAASSTKSNVNTAAAPCTSSSTTATKSVNGIDKSLEYPALFSLNHSSADETVIVQSLLNNMSIGASSNLTH
ncbi:hypothetical protein V8B55DRAFT_1530031 [Mucor lusitanicus]|uniref:K Homology domain-containing protein n=2 Tax=Mucor circinelloides f. lusitanicus TaxID=29924 RepID=A0A8H4BF06_MUCCL|nr:hypothetical protein FB192DRAFT_1383889 [Mucor lusitanicus]